MKLVNNVLLAFSAEGVANSFALMLEATVVPLSAEAQLRRPYRQSWAWQFQNRPPIRVRAYGTTTRRSMTSVTPGAAQDVSSAVCIAA